MRFSRLWIVAAAVLVSSPAPIHAQTPPTFVLSWGGLTQYGEFRLTGGQAITVGPTGDVYVADRGLGQRIIKFSSTGTYISQIPILGLLPEPAGMCLDQAGNLYVACTGLHQVHKYSPGGTLLASYGTRGTGPLQFQYPYAVTVDAQGFIYVGDKDNNRIQKLTPTGAFLEEWNGVNTGAGDFRPVHMRLSPTGYIFVVDGPRHRVLTFTLTGNLLRTQQLTDACLATGGLGGIAVDASGQYLLGNFNNNCVGEYSSTGVFIQSWGSFGSGNGQFDQVTHADLSPDGSLLYVLEDRGRRVQVFLRATPTVTVSTTWSDIKSRFVN